jgi:hypothetical protein
VGFTDRAPRLANVSAEDRAIVMKGRGAQFEVAVRYAVATILDEHADPTPP